MGVKDLPDIEISHLEALRYAMGVSVADPEDYKDNLAKK